MKHFFFLFLIIFSFSFAQEEVLEDPVVIRLDERNVTLSEFENRFNIFLGSIAMQQGMPLTEEVAAQLSFLKPQYLEQLSNEVVLLNEAENRDLSVPDESIERQLNEIKSRIPPESDFEAILQQAGFTDEQQLYTLIGEGETIRLLMEALREEVEISDEQIEKFYEENQDSFIGPEEVCARHILLETEEDAKDILTKLEQDADFAELAKEHSTGPSGPNGGDLGCFGRGQMVPPFEEATFGAEVNNPTDIIETQFGYHVALVYERHEEGARPLEQITDEIRDQLVNDSLEGAVSQLYEDSGIEVLEDIILAESATDSTEDNEETTSEEGLEGAESESDSNVEEPGSAEVEEDVDIEEVEEDTGVEGEEDAGTEEEVEEDTDIEEDPETEEEADEDTEGMTSEEVEESEAEDSEPEASEENEEESEPEESEAEDEETAEDVASEVVEETESAEESTGTEEEGEEGADAETEEGMEAEEDASTEEEVEGDTDIDIDEVEEVEAEEETDEDTEGMTSEEVEESDSEEPETEDSEPETSEENEEESESEKSDAKGEEVAEAEEETDEDTEGMTSEEVEESDSEEPETEDSEPETSEENEEESESEESDAEGEEVAEAEEETDEDTEGMTSEEVEESNSEESKAEDSEPEASEENGEELEDERDEEMASEDDSLESDTEGEEPEAEDSKEIDADNFERASARVENEESAEEVKIILLADISDGNGDSAGEMVIKMQLLASVAEGSDLATITSLLVTAGDSIDKDETLLEISIDEDTQKVSSPLPATVVEIHVSEGDEVIADQPLVTLEVPAKGAESEEASNSDANEEVEEPEN